jgi:uncharacterized integral membrane protein
MSRTNEPPLPPPPPPRQSSPPPTSQSPQPVKERWRPTKKEVIAAVIAVVALVAVLQNTRTGHFNILWFDFQAPVWIWLILNFGAGVATGLLIASRRAKKKAAALG